jgi:magnesium-transporting ATPase (P-type)
MSTVDAAGDGLVIHVKGAPEEVLARATRIRDASGERPLTPADRDAVPSAMRDHAAGGLRVLAVADRRLGPAAPVPARREDAERDLCLLGLVSLLDPPRPEVPAAIERAHRPRCADHQRPGARRDARAAAR